MHGISATALFVTNLKHFFGAPFFKDQCISENDDLTGIVGNLIGQKPPQCFLQEAIFNCVSLILNRILFCFTDCGTSYTDNSVQHFIHFAPVEWLNKYFSKFIRLSLGHA